MIEPLIIGFYLLISDFLEENKKTSKKLAQKRLLYIAFCDTVLLTQHLKNRNLTYF